MNELTREQQERVEKLLEQVLEIEPHARAAYLDSCGAPPAVHKEVESLLSYHPAARAHLESPLVDAEAVAQAVDALDSSPAVSPDPEAIGPYRILEKLGEGGMGTVYLAEQEQPLRRRVAVKLIKLGMNTRGVIARFEAERQALALMDHPNVARVFDGGATDQGRPYFVMEYVEGQRITEYCDRQRQDVAGRLQLFTDVCKAIQHAHQKGVIHRDIKPSNILVRRDNGAAIPKVIDFGVAKATNQRLTEQTLYTEQGVTIGTPEYMSPEQAGSNAADIDTRTDIYALGVLLYELLVGALPLDSASLRRAGLDEMHRFIREQQPTKPSTRLSNLGPGAEETARNRGTDVSSLRRKVRGDLEWIVMKCLEKDRDRRYATAAALIDDIERFLNQLPVVAGPPSKIYRASKFVRRHRLSVAAAAAFLLTITTLYLRAERATAMAHTALAGEARQRQAADRYALESENARKRAEAESAKLAAINGFLGGMLSSSAPGNERDRNTTLQTVLDEASAEVESGALRTEPEVEASLRMVLGTAYRDLGLYAPARHQFTAALEIETRRLGREHLEVAGLLNALGLVAQLEHLPAEAEQWYWESLEIRRRLLGDDHPAVAGVLSNLASVMLSQDRLDEAEQLHREALTFRIAAYGPEHPLVATSYKNLGLVHLRRHEYEAAEELFREALAMREALSGSAHPSVFPIKSLLATSLTYQERWMEAEALFREVLAVRRAQRGDDHPTVAYDLRQLAWLLERQQRYEESVPLLREGLSILRSKLRADHPRIGDLSVTLAGVLLALGELPEAESALREGIDILQSAHPESPFRVDLHRSLLGECLTQQGRFAEAETVLLRSYENMAPGVGSAEYPDPRSEVVSRLIELYQAWARAEDAEFWRARKRDSQTHLENGAER